MKKIKIVPCLAVVFLMACNNQTAVKAETETNKVKLVTLDPGHFHAALLQKTMYEDVDSIVHVYAPAGPDVQLHLDRINTFNTRTENPTKWKEVVYTGEDFLQKMAA